MGNVEEYKPVIAMLGLQLCYAGVTLTSEATLVNGLSPRVFILYRQAFATIFIFPFILFSRYEKVNFRNIRGLAKILGTVICVVGAVSMALIRGPKILNSEFSLPIAKSLLGDIKDQNLWLLGCLLVFVSTLCWSFSLIVQVPISAYYPDHLSLSAWLCLFSTIQCAIITFFLEKDPNAWILHSYSELATCLYAGVVTSALSTTVQAWVISQRGPLFSAMFSPLATVIVTILASMFLKEEMYTGGLIGGLFVIMGLYMVLWGKAKDVDVMIIQEQIDNTKNSEVKIQIEDSSDTEKEREMGNVEEYKPVMAMILLQLCYAGVTLSARVTLVKGTSPRVFILYRQVFATIFIFPFLYFSSITMNQNLYCEGIYLASSSTGSAMCNIIPALAFLISYLAGYETVNIRNVRGLAKISGTVLCVVGAISMTLLRGPKILNSESTLPLENSLLGDLTDQNMWLIGCLCVFASTVCYSLWLTFQVPVSAYYPDHLSLSAWMCLFGTIQCAVVTFFFDKDPNAWIIHSYSELATCLYAGVVSSALAFTVQAWVISKRGPLFSAMFNPLCTVIVTILASLILKEEMFTGSLIGGICVIMGLYIVLWGKAEDVMINQEQRDITNNSEVKIQVEDSPNTVNCNGDLKNPLLS
ncbi:hypothetical protein IGI04_013474 [Brassica rapa subsp. trilocularis]|nr:hypothetical protein IGI04_013474 [Brassica rapa subsp. trilocularis]